MTNQLMPASLLPLQGAFNFRDMGGQQASDGRSVKKGLLFRAAELTGLTPGDHLLLEAYNLKHVFDYRNRGEAEQKPDPQIGQAVNIRIPANVAAEDAPSLDLEKVFATGLHNQFSKNMLFDLYAELPLRNASYKQLMELLKNPEANLPLVHHCAAGRDRTGVGSMLILLTLGVPYETVLEDYLLSNVTLEHYHQQMFDMAAKYVSTEELKTIEETMKLQEVYLKAALDSIIREYETFDRYLLEEFGIDESMRKQIQDYCLE